MCSGSDVVDRQAIVAVALASNDKGNSVERYAQVGGDLGPASVAISGNEGQMFLPRLQLKSMSKFKDTFQI